MTTRLSDKLVLVVDDEESLLKGMLAWLEKNAAGFAVMGATDGTRALVMIDSHKPDLVVTDIRMPGLSGLELLIACRRRFPDIKFVICTAYPSAGLERDSLNSGAIRFLSKPVDMALLEKTIVEILSADAVRGQAGFMSGISVAGFVQLLAAERQTVCLSLAGPGRENGVLFLDRGELVHAECGELSGEPAALKLLAWDEAEMSILRDGFRVGRTIERSLNYLIMESVRLKDEESR
jgi:CheY-like chemotaxis protein